MPLENQEIPKKFFTLSNYLISPTQKTAEELGKYGFKTIAVKEKDQIYEPRENPLIIIEGKEYRTYQELSYLISKEPNAEHLSSREIDNILSNFVSDILKDTENFKDKNNLSQKIDETISEFLQPFTNWSVISPISGLTLPVDTFSIGTSIIKKIEESDKQKYFGETHEYFDKQFAEKFVEQTCVIVIVKSNNENSAIEKGRKKIQQILNSIRTGMGSNFFCKIKDPLLTVSSDNETKRGSLNREFERSPSCKLKESDLKLLSPITDCVSKYIDEEKPSKLQQRILRSLQWIGSSIQDDLSEDKISKLCTALETILIPESEGRKGEKLAYRITLLQQRINGKFSWPERTFWLYLKRSEIVHGSDYDQEPPNKQDVKSLEFLTTRVFELICELVTSKGFTKISQLILWLETDDDHKQGLDKWIKDNCSKEFTQSLFNS